MIGRTDELEAIRKALRVVVAGSGAVLLIDGEAGIGKTRLLEEALSNASGQGFQVFRGAAEDLEGARPFAPVARALAIEYRSRDPHRARIARFLYPETTEPRSTITAPLPELQFHIIDEILDLVERSTVDGPLVLALEDLHWADNATLVLLRATGSRFRYSPVAVLGTFRPVPHQPILDRVVERLTSVGARRLQLEPLSDDEVATLVSEVAGAQRLAPGLLDQVAGAGGNPMFVLELLAALTEEGALDRTERGDRALPPNLRLTILRRLSYLSRDALELLRVASVLGSAFSVRDLALVTGRGSPDLARSLSDPIRAGVLGESGERLAFRHDLIRDAIYEDMPLAIRRGLHREAAHRLATAGAPTARVAAQMAMGADPGDSEAIDWLAKAGREGITGGAAVVAPLLERALELCLPEDPRRDELVADLLWPLASAGRPAEAEAMARAALSRPLDPILEAQIRHGLAHALLRAGDNPGAHEQIRAAALVPGLPDERLKDYLALASQITLVVGSPQSAKDEAEQALAAADRCGIPSPEALETLGWIANLSARPLEAVRLAERANAVREVAPWASLFFIGVFELDADRISAAERALEEGKGICEELGAIGVLPIFHWGLTATRFMTGDWDQAVVEAETGLGVVEEYGERQAALFAHSFLAHIALRRGALESAEEHLKRAEQEIAMFGLQLGVDWMMWARAVAHDVRGQSEQSLAVLENVWGIHLAQSSFLAHRLVAPELVRAALASDRQELARSVTEAAEADAITAQVPSARGSALRCRGLLEDDPNVLLAAANAYEQGERRMEWAWACEDAGRALLRHKRGSEAAPLIDAALERYEHAGAAYDVARAEAALRQAGIRRGRRGTRNRPKTGWASLTPTETEVTRHVAQGLSNPQIAERMFISRRTVQTHLSHIFAKLAVSSRVELAVQAGRRGTPNG